MYMNQLAARSSSIEEARLRSEALRIGGMLCVLLIAFVIALLRIFIPGPWQGQAPLLAIIVIGIVLIYELGMLRQVRCGLRHGKNMPELVWIVNVLIESLFPPVLLLLAIDFGLLSPYLLLLSPITFLFFIVTILSTLRLEVLLCRLTGIVGGAAYIGLMLHVFLDHDLLTDHEDFIHPATMYWTAAFLIILSGFIAGFVAGQLRRHVEAAIRELEAQQARERMERDLDIARSIQQGLLPEAAPDLGDIEIAGWSRPADQTGGDYYDWLLLEDGRFIFSLADVTGHGIGPAIVTAVCRAYTRASVDTDREVHDVITRINAMLHADTPTDRFITFVLGRLDVAKCRVELLSAGHGPILYFEAESGTVRHHEAQGIPLGMLEDYVFEQPLDLEIAPGDALILVSDGFFEWSREDGEQFGVERLEQSILGASGESAQGMIDRMEADLRAFVGDATQPDDMTAVILRRRQP